MERIMNSLVRAVKRRAFALDILFVGYPDTILLFL
jgi:hypothetical protein